MSRDPAEKMPALKESLWDADDVARYLKMSKVWVRKATASGKLPYLRIGGHAIRYDPEKIKAWARTGDGGKVVTFRR